MSRDAEEVRAALNVAAPAVRRFLFGMCGCWHEADDLTQDALLKAWRKRDSFHGRAAAKTWIFRIARNEWLERLRRRRVRPKGQVLVAEEHSAPSADQPASAAMRGERARAIEAAMADLPAEQREALALRESDGLTFPQIAAMLDVPVGTVKSRVRYAVLKLARQLTAFRGELEE
jgi:RNA polymerase sigma-70 factor (ECF subfamily)